MTRCAERAAKKTGVQHLVAFRKLKKTGGDSLKQMCLEFDASCKACGNARAKQPFDFVGFEKKVVAGTVTYTGTTMKWFTLGEYSDYLQIKERVTKLQADARFVELVQTLPPGRRNRDGTEILMPDKRTATFRNYTGTEEATTAEVA